MSSAVKSWSTPAKKTQTDQLGLCRVKYYVPQYTSKPFRESRPIITQEVSMHTVREYWETGGTSPQVALVARDK